MATQRYRLNRLICCRVDAYQNYILWGSIHWTAVVACHPDAPQSGCHIACVEADWDRLTDNLIRLRVNPDDSITIHTKINHPNCFRSESQTHRAAINLDR